MSEDISNESKKVLVILRGLPWCGKSYHAKQIAGSIGVIFSTDDYWYQVVKPDKPDEYSFNMALLGKAHKWNQDRAKKAMDDGVPLIIIDNTNTVASEPRPYVEHGELRGYEILIEEPTSERWLVIGELLKDTRANKKELKGWAETLAVGSKETHNVPAFAIEKMMWRWQSDLTVDDILKGTKS